MPNCGIERAKVARKMPSDVVANRCRAVPAKNSGSEPSMGTPISPRTMPLRANAEATMTTAAIARILPAMISKGVTGITSRCSSVPCSRSRIRAAPVRTMDNIVMLLMICITPPNQALFSSGLKRARSTSSTGALATAR